MCFHFWPSLPNRSSVLHGCARCGLYSTTGAVPIWEYHTPENNSRIEGLQLSLSDKYHEKLRMLTPLIFQQSGICFVASVPIPSWRPHRGSELTQVAQNPIHNIHIAQSLEAQTLQLHAWMHLFTVFYRMQIPTLYIITPTEYLDMSYHVIFQILLQGACGSCGSEGLENHEPPWTGDSPLLPPSLCSLEACDNQDPTWIGDWETGGPGARPPTVG
jgi:hypothetical protein